MSVKMRKKLLERLDQAVLAVIDTLTRPNKLPLPERYSDKRSTCLILAGPG
jgi:hypothetical protein